MGKGKSGGYPGQRQKVFPPPGSSVSRQLASPPQIPRRLPYDAMVDGSEYTSILDVVPPDGTDLIAELRKFLRDIEQVRQRPCLIYAANIIKPVDASIDLTDDLPFSEMVASVPAQSRAVDIFLVTGGGSGQQVVRFVERLRTRFDDVSFLIPSLCMSAGTLFALSGDNIWMDERASLGPIDPQVPTRDGRFVPAQALLVLLAELQRQGQKGIDDGVGVPWSLVRAIDTLDKKELGEAMTASAYAQNMASEFLERYKFRHWTRRAGSGTPVTPEYRRSRAQEVGMQLVNHERWKAHGHSITRDVLGSEIQLLIDSPDAALQRAMRRAWAMCHWSFEKTAIQKVFLAANYAFVKHAILAVQGPIQ